MARLGHLSARDQQAVQKLAHALTNKFLHAPTVHLKALASEGLATQEVVDVVQHLFGLPQEEPVEGHDLDTEGATQSRQRR